LSNQQIGLKPNLVVSVAELGSIEAWKLTAPQLLALVPAWEYWLIVPDDQLQQFVDNSPDGYTNSSNPQSVCLLLDWSFYTPKNQGY